MKLGNMERLILGCGPRMADDDGGGGGGGNTPADDKPAVDPADDKPVDDKPADDKPDDKPADDKPADDKPDDKPADDDGEINLLDGAEKPAEKPAVAPAEISEAAAALLKEIAPVDMGLGKDEQGNYIGFDTQALGAVAPVLAELGLDKEKSNKLVAAFAQYQKTQIINQKEADAQVNRNLVAACRKEFGGDLAMRVKEANAGGEAIYGKELYAVLKGIRSFANDPAILAAHAAYGRSVSDDTGGSGKGGGGVDTRSQAERMYPEAAKDNAR